MSNFRKRHRYGNLWRRRVSGVLGALVLGACQPSPAVPPMTVTTPDALVPQEPPRITPEALQKRLDAGEPILIVDVRSAEAYAAGHIDGAISLPWADFAANHALLPKDRFIALYCT